METIFGPAYRLYHYLNVETADPRTKDHFLIGSPIPGICLLVFYNYFVNHLGPRLMEDRKPFKLDRFMIYYNIIQIVSCLYLFVEASKVWLYEYSWKCQPVDYTPSESNSHKIWLCYFYFWLKLIDLTDTFIFVMRKKFSSISFLHVYHHTGMVMLTWSGVKWFPGGHDTWLGWLNSIVHVVMYGYYLLCVLKPQYKTSMWWKKHLTQVQMIQFLLNAIHSFQILFYPDCKYPKWTVFVIAPQNMFMFWLFYRFYINTYTDNSKKKLK